MWRPSAVRETISKPSLNRWVWTCVCTWCYLFYTSKDRIFLFPQTQEDLKLAHSKDMSADVVELQAEFKRAEIKIEQMTDEKDTLLEMLKVSPRVMTSMLHFILLHYHSDIHRELNKSALASSGHVICVLYFLHYIIMLWFLHTQHFAGCPDFSFHRQTGRGEEDS